MRAALGLRAFKRLGQNFLIDEKIAERIVSYANLSSKDIVLEIGPGLGMLTERIAKKAKCIIGVEKDKRLVEHLKAKKIQNLKIINEDSLKIKFPKFNKIVSNLPYQISSQLTFKILNYKFEKAILCYQKEFAYRLVAQPYYKDYSRLTVNIYYKANCRILEIVPKSAFYPQPKVESAVVELVPRKAKPFELVNEQLFYDLVNICFSHRRKKISSIISNNWQKFFKTELEAKKVVPVLEFKDCRIEELAPQKIAKLANQIARFY
ncbi:MAG: 16S rRNA (adenine(1518)-N(6)/adenine(1519)-N(6))-dimethyltransferase RsmA [Candidatus Thermoplasmatota archaeon]|nr:16S rRNA (adenine(1518)-N(6)/adenine(1519)-N(6))-dimethyltransferase RsmA [Candidatus Thermoplasmatota archaeon]MDI6887567.1 16S rRNA (adenine(1518)-N(6)/adenine(1519)-N(6))-dimethyltransferase RsmA [Candidatus Thermoplasmatota archaeon]